MPSTAPHELRVISVPRLDGGPRWAALVCDLCPAVVIEPQPTITPSDYAAGLLAHHDADSHPAQTGEPRPRP